MVGQELDGIGVGGTFGLDEDCSSAEEGGSAESGREAWSRCAGERGEGGGAKEGWRLGVVVVQLLSLGERAHWARGCADPRRRAAM